MFEKHNHLLSIFYEEHQWFRIAGLVRTASWEVEPQKPYSTFVEFLYSSVLGVSRSAVLMRLFSVL